MALELFYVTNDVPVALIAEKSGVDRIMVDLETLGKEERQKNMNTVKSHHTVQDVADMSAALTKAELLVRVNPWNETSKREIEGTLDTLNLAFEKLLDELFEDTALDVSSDISVLQTLLAQEGLTEDGLAKMKKENNL